MTYACTIELDMLIISLLYFKMHVFNVKFYLGLIFSETKQKPSSEFTAQRQLMRDVIIIFSPRSRMRDPDSLVGRWPSLLDRAHVGAWRTTWFWLLFDRRHNVDRHKGGGTLGLYAEVLHTT